MTIVYGVILAGDRGRRLGGVEKAALKLGDGTLLDRARAALASADRLAIASAGRFEGIPAKGLTRLRDVVPDAGPLSGLAAGLAWAHAGNADWLISAPVDAPFLTAAVYRRLLAAAAPDIDAVVAEAEGRRHWLTAAWRPRLAAEARAACVRDDLSIARFARESNILGLALDDASAMFLNVNTPDDLAAARGRADAEGG